MARDFDRYLRDVPLVNGPGEEDDLLSSMIRPEQESMAVVGLLEKGEPEIRSVFVGDRIPQGQVTKITTEGVEVEGGRTLPMTMPPRVVETRSI